MKKVKGLKMFLITIMISLTMMLGACEFGISDIPSGMLFPDMEEGQDTISYLAGKLLNNYKDDLIKMLTDELKVQLESGVLDDSIDSLFSSQFDSVVDKLFDDNKDRMVAELQELLKGTTGESIFSEEETLDLIKTHLLSENSTLKDEIIAQILLEGDLEAEIINSLAKSETFVDTLMEDPDFLDRVMAHENFQAALEKAIVDYITAHPEVLFP